MVKAGEKAKAACMLRCSVCRACVGMKKNGVVARCTKCGNESFDILTGELELPGTGPGRKR